MKILVFSPYYPPHTGGLESHSDEFNKYLSEKGVGIVVFTPRLPDSGAAREILHNNVSVIRFPAFEPIHNYPVPKFWKREFWRLWKELLSGQDTPVIVSRTRFFFTSLMAYWFARKRKLRFVHIEHGSGFAQFKSRVQTLIGMAYDHVFGRFILENADTVIANSKASADFVCRLAKSGQCSIIYRGIEREELLAISPDRSLREAAEGKLIIGYIGRLIAGKGIADLLEAFAALERKDAVCVIVGDGPERVHLEKQANLLGIRENTFFLGHRNFQEAMAALKNFDIFVNPSYTEGIPTSVIEAAFCKKAIIATEVGGTPEIIGGEGDGFLIAPRDKMALIEKLSLLLGDKELRETCGNQAFDAVKDRFDWQKSAEEYLEIFNTEKK